jgi:outer membrane protein OmpA-like peptidoglycan-associated protein
MKKTIIVLACAASLFAQIPCRIYFDNVKNSEPLDASASRSYAFIESKISSLESLKGQRYETELRSCSLAVELFKAQTARAALVQKNIAVQKDIALVKDSIITFWANESGSLNKALEKERSLLTKSQRDLAQKEQELERQKAEAQKKLEALNSKTISVYKDARGTILSMSDILFESAKADLKPELKENLAEIAGILKNLLTESKIDIEGHTDNVGNNESNLKLSKQRADAVLKYLVERGVDKKRLKAVGYGLKKPVADNKTEEGRAKNRRVELVIKDK